MVNVRWITAFIDHPSSGADAEVRFWQMVTSSGLSTRRGERGQFATLLPPDGDAHLRVQETDDGSAGIHIDLHVDDVASAAGEVERLGARVVAEPGEGLVIARSPAGLSFCLVATAVDHPVRPQPVDTGGGLCTFDQVSIDIPFDQFHDECAFWSDLTGWPVHGGSVPEFRLLPRTHDMAVRLLLHRLGEDDRGTEARAHLDAAVGDRGVSIASWHTTLGARVLQRGRHWITMLDPAGLPYCLTERDPITGSLPR